MRRRSPGVATRFLLVVLIGVLLPLALVGAWLADSGRHSAERMLHDQLEAELSAAAFDVAMAWIDTRSHLLDLSELPTVREALRDGTAPDTTLPAVQQAWRRLDGRVAGIAFLGVDDAPRFALGSDAAVGSTGADPLTVRLPLHERDGMPLGSMEATLRVSEFLPPSLLSAGARSWVTAVLDAGGSPLVPLSIDPALLSRRRFAWADTEWLAARRSLAEPSLVLALAAPAEPATLPFAQTARRGGWALLLVSAAGFMLALLLTRRITTPLVRMADAADAVARGELAQRVDERGPDEIRRLGVAFNTMTRSLQRMLRRLSQQEASAALGEFAASLAHEVRNPLTSVRLDIERARERVTGDPPAAALLDRALQQIERLDATVSGSLRVARIGSLAMQPLDLRTPAEAAAQSARAHFAASGAQLHVALSDAPLHVHGHAAALEQMILNLLLNASAALPEGGAASITARADEDAVEVCVRDDGCGIPAEALERVLEPFYTTREEGTGLGLTIVRRIAESHGGELRIRSSAGSGTDITIRLPAAVTKCTTDGTFRNDSGVPALR